MTHSISVKEAPSERPIAGSETATMLESSTISEETNEQVRSTQNCGLVVESSVAVTDVMASPSVIAINIRAASSGRRRPGRKSAAPSGMDGLGSLGVGVVL